MEQERHSREVWEKRVARWKDGGLSANEFAAEIGVNPRTLVYWKWRLGSEAKKRPTRAPRRVSPAPAPSFVEVTPASPQQSTPFELVIGDIVLRVPIVFDADALRRLVATVRA